VFFKGCPLRCAWCQNPESQAANPQLLLHEELCLGCDACLEICPERETSRQEGHLQRPDTCTACGRCAEVCPSGARRIAGRAINADELVGLALRDLPFYGDQGGVTLSGGEPLVQWAFVRTLADRLQAEGVHVALDTACAGSRDAVHEVPEHVDLVLADLKLVTLQAHRRWTGADNAHILEAIHHWSCTMPGRLWISVPLIPGVQDEAELGRMADFILSLPNRPPVRLLPYHRLGDSKYGALGWAVPRFRAPVEPLVERARDLFRGKGLYTQTIA
jgi:pyruvate formate lyase activating enzyme